MSSRRWGDDELYELAEEVANRILGHWSTTNPMVALRIVGTQTGIIEHLLKRVGDSEVELSSDREEALEQIEDLYLDPWEIAAKILDPPEAA